MKIKWLGHACFLITDSNGKKILTDPFDKSVGYDLYEGDADLVTVSHHHHDHDYVSGVKENPVIIDEAGTYKKCGIEFEGIPSYHDKNQGADRGKNIIFVFNVDGYKICHLGDLGYELSDDEISKLRNVDILLIPVGGKYTIDANEAARVALSINSHVVIPMHYKTPALGIALAGTEEFVSAMDNAEYVDSNTLKIEGKLDGYNKVKVLGYK